MTAPHPEPLEGLAEAIAKRRGDVYGACEAIDAEYDKDAIAALEHLERYFAAREQEVARLRERATEHWRALDLIVQNAEAAGSTHKERVEAIHRIASEQLDKLAALAPEQSNG